MTKREELVTEYRKWLAASQEAKTEENKIYFFQKAQEISKQIEALDAHNR